MKFFGKFFTSKKCLYVLGNVKFFDLLLSNGLFDLIFGYDFLFGFDFFVSTLTITTALDSSRTR